MWLIPVSVQSCVASKTSFESAGFADESGQDHGADHRGLLFSFLSAWARIAMMLTDESAIATAMTGDNNTQNTG